MKTRRMNSGRKQARGCRRGAVEQVRTLHVGFEKGFSSSNTFPAMGEMLRKWPFRGDSSPAFDLVIREPPLTGDKLGLKTWGSSYRMAQMLPGLASSYLSHLLPARARARQDVVPILELGSGTGLLGLAAAVTWRREVILSDLPSIMPNLVSNIELNQATLEAQGGSVRAGALTWGGDEDEIDQSLFQLRNQFKVRKCPGHAILGAEAADRDPLDHPGSGSALRRQPSGAALRGHSRPSFLGRRGQGARYDPATRPDHDRLVVQVQIPHDATTYSSNLPR